GLPAADAEARLRPGLAHDPGQVRGDRPVLLGAAGAGRGVHHARQPGLDVTAGGAGMVLYEVTVRVERALADAYLAWLPGHVRRILELDGFEAAEAFEVVESPPDADHLLLCVHYRVRDEAALD